MAIAGCLASVGFGFSALLVDLTIVYEEFGSEGLSLSLIVAPLTFLSVPWYALLNQSDLVPILLGYAAPLGGWLLTAFGRSLESPGRDDSRTAAQDPKGSACNVIAFRPGATLRRGMARRRARERAARLVSAPARNRETL